MEAIGERERERDSSAPDQVGKARRGLAEQYRGKGCAGPPALSFVSLFCSVPLLVLSAAASAVDNVNLKDTVSSSSNYTHTE